MNDLRELADCGESLPMVRPFASREATAPVVVITGGSSGIGRCVAALFARRGWRVGLIARGAEGLAASSRDVEAAGRLLAAVAQRTDRQWAARLSGPLWTDGDGPW